MIKKLSLITALALVILMSGCSGSGDPFAPATPTDILGDWQGTYENNVVGVGIIQVSFFMDGSTLRVTYDLQGGEVTGTSNVSINGRTITFIGVGTNLQEFSAYLNMLGTGMTGTLIIDYTLYGTRSGPVEITKI